MADKSVMIDMNDPRADRIAEVITNSTCKKILNLLADKEMSESEIAEELEVPLNTVGYNIKKLMEAELIEKTKDFFWSVKGKKIPKYKVSRKRIIISPRESFRGVIPSVLISAAVALGIKTFAFSSSGVEASAPVYEEGLKSAGSAAASSAMDYASGPSIPLDTTASDVYYTVVNSAHSWAWFLFGALLAMTVFLIWNWRKIW